MELESVKPASVAKKLILRHGGGAEAHAGGGKVKNVSVPVSRNKIRGEVAPERVIARDGIKGDREESDLVVIASTDGCTQGKSHELCSETQAEHWFLSVSGFADEIAFAGEVGVFVVLVGTLASAADRKSVESVEMFGQRIAGIRVPNLQPDISGREGSTEETWLVGVSVLDKKNFLHERWWKSNPRASPVQAEIFASGEISELPERMFCKIVII